MSAREPKRIPAYLWYPRDFDMDEEVKLMTYEEEGVYRRLLDHQWFHDGLPADVKQIARLVPKLSAARFRKLWPSMAMKFQARDGRLVNPKLEAVRNEAESFRTRRAEAGKLGGQAKASRLRAERMAAARDAGTHTESEWLEMVSFFGGRCVKCGASEPLHKDHIIPVYQLGSSDAIWNIQPLCGPCNQAKGPDRTDYRGPVPSKWTKQGKQKAS